STPSATRTSRKRRTRPTGCSCAAEPAMARDPALTPMNAPRPFAPVEGLKLPAIASTADAMLEHALHRRLQPEGQPANALGQLRWLAGQLARIQHSSALPFDLLVFDAPQLVVFAA